MVHEGDIVSIYNSIHRVMKVEKLLKAARVEMLLIPVPRQLSSDCGLAIRCPETAWPKALSVLGEAGVEPSGVYRFSQDEFVEI